MNKTIKVSLILIVAIGILLLIILFANSIGNGESKEISPIGLVKHIEERTDQEIKNKSYEEASIGFKSVFEEIKTESSITLGSGEKALSDEEVLNARKIAFYEYAPIFIQYGKSYFNNSSWDSSTLKTIRSEALELHNLKIAQKGEDADNDLNSLIKSVNNYFSALNVIHKAKRCSSDNELKKIKQQIKLYSKDENLRKNHSFIKKLEQAEYTAKKNLEAIKKKQEERRRKHQQYYGETEDFIDGPGDDELMEYPYYDYN